MTEPTDPIKGLILPLTGDLPGAWGTTAVNPNFSNIATMAGGFATISLSAATTIVLTGPSGSITPGGNTIQQYNAMLRFTGSQTGTATVQFSLPGRYVIDHQASTSFPIVLAPASGTGTQIGAPWWRKCAIFFDGTNVDYENPENPGAAIDLHGVTGLPNWMQVCSKQYALVKDGSTYSTAAFPGLAAVLGSAFGGNGVTTFGVPDERSRMRLPLDTGGTNRVTSGGSGINGAQMGAAGGNELLQSHSHANTLSDLTHVHNLHEAAPASIFSNGLNPALPNPTSISPSNPNFVGTTDAASTGITINNAVAGGGGGQNMPPAIVSFLALLKT
jgi:microcystin-dependent protein